MARVYVATDDRLQVSAVSGTAATRVCWLWTSARSTLLHWGSSGPPVWLKGIASGILSSSSPGTVSSSGTAGPADLLSFEFFAGSRSETSSEMKLSLVTFGMWGLGVSTGWSVESVGAWVQDSGEAENAGQLAPSMEALSMSDSTSLTTDWARTSPQKKIPALWSGRKEKVNTFIFCCWWDLPVLETYTASSPFQVK